MSATLPPSAPAPLAFVPGAPATERLAACKAYLAVEGATLRAQHELGASGLEIVHARAASMDAMLAQLFEHAVSSFTAAQGKLPAPVTLVALGGYGRSGRARIGVGDARAVGHPLRPDLACAARHDQG